MTTHNADHTQRHRAGVACLNVGVGELGAGGLLGSTSAGVGVWRRRRLLLLLVRRNGGSQRRCHVPTDVTCSHDIDVAVLSARRCLLRRVRFSGRLPLSDKSTANRAAVM